MARGIHMGASSAMGGNATAADILTGKSALVDGEEVFGEMTNVGAISQLISTVAQSIILPQGYHNGQGTVGLDPTAIVDLIQSNIRENTTILGVTGNVHEGTDTSTGTVTASDMLSGKTAYSKGSKITGNISSQAAKTVTPTTSSQTAVTAGKYCSGAITVGAIPNQTTGGTKYASTSAQTLLANPKWLTSNLVVSAVSQTNLAAANILRGKTITIKNGNGNIWSVAGNTSGLKYVTGTVNAGGNTKFLAKDNSGNGSYQYYGTANPGMTPVFCFSYSTNYEATICWRYASNTADWIEMPHLQSSYSSQISGWSWASNAVDIPVRDINTDNVGAISYIIFGY